VPESTSFESTSRESTALEGPELRTPNLYIIGAAKSGTSSIRKYLAQHPEVFVTPHKEPDFFGEEYERGMAWYVEHYYARWGAQRYGGESGDKMFPPFVAERMGREVAGAKLVAVLRDPVKRAFSHWWMNFSRGKETLSFAEAIDDNLRRRAAREARGGVTPPEWAAYRREYKRGRMTDRFYVELGEYRRALEPFYRDFGAESLHVLLNEEIHRDPRGAVAGVFAFLGLEPPPEDRLDLDPANTAGRSRQSPAFHALARAARALPFRLPFRGALRDAAGRLLRREGVEPPAIDPATAERLRRHYDEENRALAALLGRAQGPAWLVGESVRPGAA
jgi:Sulfotransferase domain